MPQPGWPLAKGFSVLPRVGSAEVRDLWRTFRPVPPDGPSGTGLGPGAFSCRHHLGGAAPARRRRHVHVSRVGAGRSPVLQQCAVGAKIFLWGHLRAKIAAEMLVWAAPQEGRWHVRLFRVGPGGGALAVQCAAGAKNYQHATPALQKSFQVHEIRVSLHPGRALKLIIARSHTCTGRAQHGRRKF